MDIMDIFTIITIIAVGLVLVLVEIFLIPGTTVVGAVGYVMVIIGVVLSYTQFDNNNVGHITLGTSTVATVVLLYLSYKAYTSRRLSLNEVIDGKVNILEEGLVKPGDTGRTASYLRPHGIAEFNELRLEVFSQDEFIESDVDILITKIEHNKIFVKPIDKTTA